MTPGGYSVKIEQNEDGEDEETMKFKFTNDNLDEFFDTPPINDFIKVNYLNYIAHIVRRPADHPTKKALFIVPERPNAPSVFRKLRFLLPEFEREDLLKKMNNSSTFQQLLKMKFPYLRKKKSAKPSRPRAERSLTTTMGN